MSAAPVDHAWNFSLCPPDEELMCYFYEYMLELPSLCEAVATWKDETAAVLVEPPDAGPAAEQNFQVWAQSVRQLRPPALAQLDGMLLHLVLLFIEFFPQNHWLEIPEKTRATRSKLLPLWQPVLDVTRCSWEQIAEMRLGQCGFPWSPAEWSTIESNMPELSALLPVQEHRLLINWRFPRTRLKQELERWLDREFERRATSPRRQEISAVGKSEPERARDHLKQLAAARLMRAFNNDWRGCRDYAQSRWRERPKSQSKRRSLLQRTESTSAPYRERKDEWAKAAAAAAAHVREFARKIVS